MLPKKVKQHNYGMTLAVHFSGLPSLLDKDKPISQTSHSLNGGSGHLGWAIDISKSIPTEEMYAWRGM